MDNRQKIPIPRLISTDIAYRTGTFVKLMSCMCSFSSFIIAWQEQQQHTIAA
jgi:hypothetical protein